MRRSIRLAVLAAAPWPILRAGVNPALARAYPRRTAIRLGYVAAYVAIVVLCALFAPWLLVAIAAVAAVGLLVGHWLTAARYGHLAGLAPGRLELIPVRPFVEQEFAADLFEQFGPVFKTIWPTLTEPTVCMKDIPGWATLVREHDGQLGPVGIAFDPLIPAGFLRNMKPSDHDVYYRAFRQAFTTEVTDECRPHFADCVRVGLETMRIASEGASRGIDARPFLRTMVEAAFIRLFTGLMPGTAKYAMLQQAYDEMGYFVEMRSPASRRGRRLAALAGEIDGAIRDTAAEIVSARERGENPPRSFLSELLRANPGAAGDPNITLNLVYLLRTSSSDVTGLLHWIVKMLGDHHVWIERLRAGDDDLARRIVFETLRLEQSEFVQRRTLDPITVDGYVVPSGWNVRLCVHEAHRDPAVFPNPDAFDPDRFLGRRYTGNEYQPFGRSRHRCLGVTTTEVFAETFVSQLGHYDLAVVRDGPVVFDRYHWRPSRRFRIAVAARA